MPSTQYRLTTLNGTPYHPFYEGFDLEEFVETFKVRETDVFVCSYAKSGTTWTQQIVNLLANGERGSTKVDIFCQVYLTLQVSYQLFFQSFHEVVPWIEAAAAGGEMRRRCASGLSLGDINANKGRRFFKTHAHLKDFPGRRPELCKVIYVARNPKDVVVSLYHHAKNRPAFDFDGTFSDMLYYFMNGKCEIGSWSQHVTQWWQKYKEHPDRILFIHYEDMKLNPHKVIKQIAEFMDITVSDSSLEYVIKMSSFDEMKKAAKIDPKFKHFRQGEIGNWQEYFSSMKNKLFDEWYKKEVNQEDLTFYFGHGIYM